MIYSSIAAQVALCAWPEPIAKALQFLQTEDLEHLPVGRYEIDGGDVFAMIQLQTTAPAAEKRAESHFRYIDIQYLIQGKELQGYAPLKAGCETEPYPERDVIYYPEVADEQFIALQPGDFTIYFTNDIHRPNCAVGDGMEIKKVVVKIRENML